jgi:hypothetical protein
MLLQQQLCISTKFLVFLSLWDGGGFGMFQFHILVGGHCFSGWVVFQLLLG